MKDLEMCHLKMVFDAFNESLNYIRFTKRSIIIKGLTLLEVCLTRGGATLGSCVHTS
jgi:hypothetical protein